jgi:hypothetical protein
LPVWPQPRPKPVLWLAIDDGSGPRWSAWPRPMPRVRSSIARSSAATARPARRQRAEQAAVGAIWRGDTAAVARISRATSPPMQLIGKLYRDQAAGTPTGSSSTTAGAVDMVQQRRDAARAMSAGADGAADALCAAMARRRACRPAGSYRVLFTGIDSGDDYMRLSGYLQAAVVRGSRPVRATPHGLELDLELTRA